ncbi:MAG: type II toxin-antitoxin system HicB family antitoxin [Methanoregula sp.]|nr:type II toxin-antitoxin system HicB family antitoxin [Methanoregula sp.]
MDSRNQHMAGSVEHSVCDATPAAVHIGLLHHAGELPGVGGERLDVPPLAFCVERIERERGFAGAGDTGDHHELVAGDPGAISQSETREEALANTKEALELVLEVQREELHRKSPTHNREISRVEVADVA